MKGVGWLVILLGLLGVSYLVVRDLGVLTGERDGAVVIEPLEKTRDAAALVQRTRNSLKESLDKISE